MGYSTDFQGSFKFNKLPTAEQIEYFNTFVGTRRMKRDVSKLQEMFDGQFGLNGSYGIDGEYFAKDDGFMGQNRDESIVEYNSPPSNQPGLWCKWVINEEDCCLEWDGGEKFYEYVGWLNYLIAHFFEPWGIILNGKVKWQGEDIDDRGRITIKNNLVTVKELT